MLQWNIATFLTFTRLFISPIFLFVYVEHDALGISSTVLPYVLWIILGASELSDAFDGYIARRFNQVTEFGKLLDPMADSIARISVFLTFTLEPVKLPMMLVFVFLYRDAIISTLRTICALKGFALAARSSGKIKAVIQAIAAFCILALMMLQAPGYISLATLQWYSFIAASIAAAYSLYSGIEYIHANWRLLKSP